MEEKLFHHYCGAGRRGWSNVTRTFQQPKMKNLDIKLSSLTHGQLFGLTLQFISITQFTYLLDGLVDRREIFSAGLGS